MRMKQFVQIPDSQCQVSMLKKAEGGLGLFLIPQQEQGDQKCSEP